MVNAGYSADVERLPRNLVPEEPYRRRILHSGARGEVMIAEWCAGGRAAPHDHGPAQGRVFVLSGRFVENTYVLEDGELRVSGTRMLGPGAHTRVWPGLIHDMQACDAGLTLHVYTPGIDVMRVYDTVARATWLVGSGAGAWIPREWGRVVARERWP